MTLPDILKDLLNQPQDNLDVWLVEHQPQLNSESVQALKAEAEHLAEIEDNLSAALFVLNRAEAIAQRLAEPAMGHVWRGRANVLQRHDRFAESLAASEQAVAFYEQHGTEFEVAVARTIQVYVLGALERFDEAIETGEWVRHQFNAHKFTRGLAYVTCNLGQVHTRAWRLADAIETFEQAKRLFQDLEEVGWVAQVNHDLGVVADQMDQLPQAEAYYRQAYPQFVAEGNVFLMAKTQFNLADLCLRQGRYDEALAHITQARSDRAGLTDSLDAAYVALIEARVRRALNQNVEAKKLLEEALNTFTAFGHHIEAAQTLMALGTLLAEQKTPAGLSQGLDMLDRAEREIADIDVPLLLAWLKLEQGEYLLRLERITEAAQCAELGRDLFQAVDLHLRQAHAEALLADCYWQLRPELAGNFYQKALKAAEDRLPILAARCWRGLGRIAGTAGQLAEMNQAYEKSISLLDTVRRSLHSHNHQAGFLEDKQALVEELLAMLHTQSAPADQVLLWVERFKAQVLADLLVSQPYGHDIDSRLRSLLEEREQLRNQVDQTVSSLNSEPAAELEEGYQRLATVRSRDSRQVQEMPHLLKTLQTLDEQIARFQDTSYRWRESEAIDSSDLQTLLNQETVLVSYYTANDQLFALTATHDPADTAIHPLNVTLDTVETRWPRIRRQLMRPSKRLSDIQSRLAQLWEMLIEPIKRCLRDKRHLLILPHRGLFHIPFASLYDRDQGCYLIERWSLQLAPSVTILKRCREQVTSLGNPLLVGYPGEPGQVDFLPGIERELKILAEIFPKATVLFGEEATFSNVLSQFAERSVVHLAGHILYDHAHPLESGMPLADGRWLRASDLYLRHGELQGATVVLSGCNSGRVRPTGGDILGLNSAFLYAGASSLVTGLWPIDDEATVDFIQRFYGHLIAGSQTAKALCLAQQELLQDEPYRHPFYWAPFNLSGATTIVTMRESS